MSTHTHGDAPPEVTVIDHEVLVALGGAVQYIGVEIGGVSFVARVRNREIGDDQSTTHKTTREFACLLAAAPDLLAACEALVARYDTLGACADKACVVCAENRERMDRAKAAITKARGGTP